MPMTKSQNKNSSEYVTISTAPFLFLRPGAKEAAPEGANRLPYWVAPGT